MASFHQAVRAMNNSTLTPAGHSSAARTPVKPRAVGKHFADRLAAEQARVEAEIKRVEAELEETRAQLVSSSSDSDSDSWQSLPRRSKSFHNDYEVSKTPCISPPTEIGGIQNDISAINRQLNNEPMVTKQSLELFKTDLQNSFELLLANVR